MSHNKWKQMRQINDQHKELAKRILVDREEIELPEDFREKKNYIWRELDNRFWGRKMYAVMGGPQAYEALMSLVELVGELREQGVDLRSLERMIELVQGNIVRQEVDAIVNAANSAFYVGSGVDGAIHDAGGPTIQEERERLYPQGCPTGSAKITGAGDLPAKYVIHAVGPVWHGGGSNEAENLASAYRTALELAVEYGCNSIAFPAISTGVYGYPIRPATEIAIKTAVEFTKEHPMLVRFVLWDKPTYDLYEQMLEDLRDDDE